MARISTMNSATPSEASPASASGHQEDQRDEGRQHEHVAVGEVHHADDAEHHRVADGDQAVDGAERQPVDRAAERNIPCAVSPPRRRVRRSQLQASRECGVGTTRGCGVCASDFSAGGEASGVPRCEPAQITLWVPSQNGLSSVLLQPQRLKVPELPPRTAAAGGWWPCESRRRRAAWPSARRCTRNTPCPASRVTW